MELWERFSSRAKQSILMAHDEALRDGAIAISTEHLLLGLARLRDGVAARILLGLNLDLDIDQLRAELRPEAQADTQEDNTSAEVAFTLAAQRVLRRSYNEARQLDDFQIGTEHILIGMLLEGNTPAAELLCGRGADLEAVSAALAEQGPGIA